MKVPFYFRVVLIEIPQFLGGSCLEDVDHIVPITPLRRTWYEQKTECSRTALPIVPAYAMTIHKSQGQTLDQILINLGK